MRDEVFEELLARIRENGAIQWSEIAPTPNGATERIEVRDVREQYRLTQREFSALLGISVRTLRNWEQGRRAPDGPARVLLMVAARHPEAMWDVRTPAQTA